MATQVVRLQASGTLIIGGVSSGRSARPACTIQAAGTFGSGTLIPQVGFMSTTGVFQWLNITGLTGLTAAGVLSFDMKFDGLRLSLSGATGPDIQVAVFI